METPLAHNPSSYGITDRKVADALVAIMQDILARYDDDAILGVQQERLVRTVRDEVRQELRHRIPDTSADMTPRTFLRALTAYITAEIRTRQGWAFERQLAREYGPLDPDIDERLAAQTFTVGRVTVVSTVPIADDERTQSA